MFSRKRKWKIKSFKEPSLIVVSTGFPILSRHTDEAGGLAKVLMEPKQGETEISFLFDFRGYYASLFVWDLVDAILLFGATLPYYLKSQSLYGLPLIGIMLLGLFVIPWFGHSNVKKTKAEVVSVTKAAIRKRDNLEQ